MNCWEILKIGETKDEDKIKKAYLRLLPHFHPEEDPEGFRNLRQAMEEAIQIAAGQREEQPGILVDSQELRDFIKQAKELYQDYGRRISREQWKALLELPVCQDLETQKEAGWALVGFLMDHFHLPHDCYQVMDETFGWTEAEEELRHHFSEDFVKYLIQRIEEEDSFRYEKTPVREEFDYDRFFEAFFTLRVALGEKDRERAEKMLEELDAMEIEHPDLTILKIRHFSMVGEMADETWELAKRLYETDGEYGPSRYWYVQSALRAKDPSVLKEKLEDMIVDLLKEDPENPGYWQLCGNFLAGQNRLKEALQAFERARTEEEWGYLEEQIFQTAQALSLQMEEEGYEDNWEMIQVCWRARRYDKVRQLLEETEPGEKESQWLFMMAESCHRLEDYKNALKYRKRIWQDCGEEDRPLNLYLDLAEDYRLSGEWEKALEVYGQAAEIFPQTPELYYRQAKILEEQRQTQKAADLCSQALKVGFHRESLDLRLELLLNMEQYEQVREEAEHVINQGYRAAQVLYDYVKALHELEDYSGAEEILKELYERTQGSEMVCEEYASLCYDSDRNEEALRWINEALEKRETLRRLYLKGSCLHDLKQYEEEIAVYDYLGEKGEDDYYLDYRMGRALEQAGRLEEAERRIRQSLAKRSDYSLVWDVLGDVLQKQGKWDQALEAYEEGTKLGHLQSARDLCRLLKRLHRDDRAIECIEENLKRWPKDGSLLILYSDILVRKKEYEAAVRCLNRYIEARPAQTERGYREIALCYEKAKEMDKAREYYQKAIDTAPGSARCWRMMGKFLANEMKDQEQALPFLKKSVELAPDSTYGWMKLGEVYEALGQKKEALECYEKSLENYRIDLEKDPDDCCSFEGIADVLIHLGRLDEAEEMAHKAISLQCSVFICSCTYCYESFENLSKIEEKRGNLEKALERMKQAGKDTYTDYYPKEIARLKEAVDREKNS